MGIVQEENQIVSIVIPTYNYAAFLPTAIRSCLDQTYKPIEILVVDDGSTDNTKDVIKEFNNHITYFFQENRGVSAARNRGLELAKGDYITFLDSDDYLTNDSLELRIEILKKHTDIGIVFTSTYSKTWGKEELRYRPKIKKPIISDKFYEDLLLRKIPFQTSATLMRGSIAKRFRFPTHLSNGEDIVLRMAVKPIPSISLPQRTINLENQPVSLRIRGRHDVSAIPRILPVCEAMVAIVLADHLLRQKTLARE